MIQLWRCSADPPRKGHRLADEIPVPSGEMPIVCGEISIFCWANHGTTLAMVHGVRNTVLDLGLSTAVSARVLDYYDNS